MVSADLLGTLTGIWMVSALIPETRDTTEASTPLTVICFATGPSGRARAAGNVSVTVSLPSTSSPRPPVPMLIRYPVGAPAISLSG